MWAVGASLVYVSHGVVAVLMVAVALFSTFSVIF